MNFKVSASLLCWACTEFGGYKLEATLFHAQSITTSNWVMFLNPQSSDANFLATEGIMQILGLEKTHGTCCCGICGSENRVIGGPPVDC